MKKLLIAALGFVMLQACENSSGEGQGTIDDGMNNMDTNGALNDGPGPLTDSTGDSIENHTRTDIQQRDTFKNNPSQ